MIQAHYRYGEEHKFPGPVFDVAAAYDWIVANMFASNTSSREPAAKIAVCGELLGGTLASALALTECRPKEPAAVVAAAINNPVLNWVDFEATTEGSDVPQRGTVARLSMHEICEARRLLFRNAADHFDPFASPMLFFRAAGSRVPPPAPDAMQTMTEMDELIQAEQDQLLPQGPNAEAPPAVDSASLRKSSRRFPSKSLALRLPRFSLCTGVESQLTEQATEFRRLLLKSFERQSRVKSPRSRDMERMQLLSPEHLVVQDEVKGLGVWDDSAEARQRMQDTAYWLAEALKD